MLFCSPHPPPSGAPSPQGEGLELNDKLKFTESAAFCNRPFLNWDASYGYQPRMQGRILSPRKDYLMPGMREGDQERSQSYSSQALLSGSV